MENPAGRTPLGALRALLIHWRPWSGHGGCARGQDRASPMQAAGRQGLLCPRAWAASHITGTETAEMSRAQPACVGSRAGVAQAAPARRRREPEGWPGTRGRSSLPEAAPGQEPPGPQRCRRLRAPGDLRAGWQPAQGCRSARTEPRLGCCAHAELSPGPQMPYGRLGDVPALQAAEMPQAPGLLRLQRCTEPPSRRDASAQSFACAVVMPAPGPRRPCAPASLPGPCAFHLHRLWVPAPQCLPSTP